MLADSSAWSRIKHGSVATRWTATGNFVLRSPMSNWDSREPGMPPMYSLRVYDPRICWRNMRAGLRVIVSESVRETPSYLTVPSCARPAAGIPLSGGLPVSASRGDTYGWKDEVESSDGIRSELQLRLWLPVQFQRAAEPRPMRGLQRLPRHEGFVREHQARRREVRAGSVVAQGDPRGERGWAALHRSERDVGAEEGSRGDLVGAAWRRRVGDLPEDVVEGPPAEECEDHVEVLGTRQRVRGRGDRRGSKLAHQEPRDRRAVRRADRPAGRHPVEKGGCHLRRLVPEGPGGRLGHAPRERRWFRRDHEVQ